MAGELVDLAAFFVEPHPSAPFLDVVVFHLHPDHRADPREGVAHERDQRTISQIDQFRCFDRIEKCSHLVGRQHGGLALLHAVLRAAHGVRRIERNNLTGDEPIEEHPDRRQVLLDSRLGMGFHDLLDVAGNVDRLHLIKRNFSRFAPG